MKVRKLLHITMASLLMSMELYAQTPAPNAMPVIVPPSPELASLVKAGAMSTSLHTGAASVSIPLHQLSNGGVSIPISLNYAGNGIKVNDIASRVGLGWNLAAGGVITRVIHDEDDFAVDVQHPALPSSLTPLDNNSALYNYLLEANMPNKDTEKDEYSFSVNGMSGRFFLDAGGNVRQVEHSNIRITKNGDEFVLTDAAGVQYYFGQNGNVEKTRGYQTNGNGRWDRISTTGWFLTSVKLHNRLLFSFNYISILTETLRGPSQTMTIKPTYGEPGTGTTCTDCDPICAGLFQNAVMNVVRYDTRQLQSISVSNGVQVYFVYESRGDAGGDSRLKIMSVQHNLINPAVETRKYTFEYDDYAISGDVNKRFYLKKLKQEATGTFPAGSAIASSSPQVYEFEYDDPAGLPSQRSYGQDYYGYANGYSNTHFVPRPANYQMYYQGNLLATRTPDFNYMKKGMLTKVIYPTGGYEAYTYEQHTLPELKDDSVFVSSGTTGRGQNTPVIANTFTFSFTTNQYSTVTAKLSASQHPDGPFPGTNDYPAHWYPNDGHKLVEFKIKRLDNSNATLTYSLNIYDTIDLSTQTLNLAANTSYVGELKVYGKSTFGMVILKHSPSVNPYWTNKPVCGLRVKNIESYDPVAHLPTYKYYNYAAVTEMAKSSGKGVAVPAFLSQFASGGICITSCMGSGNLQIECTNNIQLSSSSLSRLPDYNGSPVAYTDVIESDQSNFVNGVVHHKFYTLSGPEGVSVALFGPGILTAPTGSWPTLNGKEILTGYYKQHNNQLKLIKKIENVYSTDSRVYHELTNYVHRQRWIPYQYTEVGAYGMQQLLKPFDMASYSYKSEWIHLDQTTVTEYDTEGLNPLTTVTQYDYGNVQHTLPTRISTTGSNGETIVQENKYPVDYAFAPFTGMVNQNQLSPVIEAKSIRPAATQVVTTAYKDWFGNGHVIRPWYVNMKKGANADETRLRYHERDVDGNILEVSKENGARVAYVWDNAGMPVAEVKNASLADIAYASFETSSYGQWSIPGGYLPPGSIDFSNYYTFYNDGLAGNRSFGGRLTRAVNAGQIYKVSLWSKAAAAPTVNSLPGTLRLTKQGWKLYDWTITGSSSITVQGEQMDHVRLHPKAAFMTSYSYYPHVGTAAVMDAANGFEQYEYDGFGRLLIVRNMDGQIIKQYDYKYLQPIAPCPNAAANWVATGSVQCVTDANNNYTGVRKVQQMDENNCSATYLHVRWELEAAPQGQCELTTGCTGPDKRWITTGGTTLCETGVKTVVSSVKVGNTWYCTFRYIWSDGYQGPTFEESGTQRCIGEITEM